jgi:hypothetical protein
LCCRADPFQNGQESRGALESERCPPLCHEGVHSATQQPDQWCFLKRRFHPFDGPGKPIRAKKRDQTRPVSLDYFAIQIANPLV